MVLRPAAGVGEGQTSPGDMPWLDRRNRGSVVAFLSTLRLALLSPARLAEGIPVRASVGHAIAFAAVLLLVTLTLGGTLPTLLYWHWSIYIIGGWWIDPIAMLFLAVVLGLAVIGLLPIWAMVAQALLRLTGPVAYPVDRTMCALAYSTGANAMGAVPCIGPVIGMLWWMSSAVIMVSRAQRVSVFRSTFAVLALPVCTGAVGFLFVTLMAGWWYGVGYSDSYSTGYQTGFISEAVRAYADSNDGKGPEHAAELVLDGFASPWEFIGDDTDTYTDEVPIGSLTLLDLETASGNRIMRAITEANDAADPDRTAHRVGDFVFTYHGIDLRTAHADLWIVIDLDHAGHGGHRRAGVGQLDREVARPAASVQHVEPGHVAQHPEQDGVHVEAPVPITARADVAVPRGGLAVPQLAVRLVVGGHPAGCLGTTTRNSVRPGSDSTRSCPRCSLVTMSHASESPSPVP